MLFSKFRMNKYKDKKVFKINFKKIWLKLNYTDDEEADDDDSFLKILLMLVETCVAVLCVSRFFSTQILLKERRS